ncbi:hypothetical protein C8R44DRAFT_753697 [Mycena epipterygia]|nr:hypothetical protein C8R44DRAFT_753697 [Mycena epipterygia]
MTTGAFTVTIAGVEFTKSLCSPPDRTQRVGLDWDRWNFCPAPHLLCYARSRWSHTAALALRSCSGSFLYVQCTFPAPRFTNSTRTTCSSSTVPIPNARNHAESSIGSNYVETGEVRFTQYPHPRELAGPGQVARAQRGAGGDRTIEEGVIGPPRGAACAHTPGAPAAVSSKMIISGKITHTVFGDEAG